jgi:hypothetical protein
MGECLLGPNFPVNCGGKIGRIGALKIMLARRRPMRNWNRRIEPKLSTV